jgi:hypothetical protein
MSVVAAIRPSEWELPLFVHVLGSMVLVGALVLAVTYLVPAWRTGSVDSVWLGFRTLLIAALPAFLVMRLSAQWIASEEDVVDSDAAWIGIGYMTSDMGLLVLLAATIVGGVGVRRARRAGATETGRSGRVLTVLVALMLVAYLVAIWAMTTKPG